MGESVSRTAASDEPTAFESTIESITSEGAGVGRLPDGRAVFIHRTAPGDRVRAVLTHETARWARAKLQGVSEAGPSRREAPCPHYARCGGCTLEHLTYEAQLDAKGMIVTDALERIGKLDGLPELRMHGSPKETRYRNRVTFTLLRLGGDRVVAGFHELERPGRILDVDGRCLLPEAALAETWDGLRSAWGPGARNLPSGRRLRLTLRGNRRGEVLLLVEGATGTGDPDALIDAVPGLCSIWITGPGVDDRPRLLAGVSHFVDEWLGEEVNVRPGAFLQVNREAAERLQEVVMEEIGPAQGRRVVDAYCGSGTYGRRLARDGARVLAIEADPGAAAMARERAEADFDLVEGRVEDRLEESLPADIVILNPPRSGLGDGVPQMLAASRPERIVYVSCDPATLARDASRLGQGFRPTGLHAVDLFPQTARIEAVLTLTAE